MTGGYVFTAVCLFNFGGGIPDLRSGQGGYPISGLDRGVPHPRSRWGVPHPRSGQGGYPITGLDRGGTHPRSGLGGYPILQMWGIPWSKIGWGTPHPDLGWGHTLGTPQPSLDGVPPIQTADWGVPWVPPQSAK